MPHLGTTTECQQPHCTDDAEETYHGPNDNTLRLCEKHYYTLVSRQSDRSHSIDLGPGIVGGSDTISTSGTTTILPPSERHQEPKLVVL